MNAIISEFTVYENSVYCKIVAVSSSTECHNLLYKEYYTLCTK